MSWHSLGSLALPHQLQRRGVSLRSEVAQLGVELTTGESNAPQRRLGGNIGPLVAIEARLTRIDAFSQNAKQAAVRADLTLTALARLDTTREAAAQQMLAAAAGRSEDTLQRAATGARNALDDALATLSQRADGQAVFSGTATDRAPLPDADIILAAVLPLVSGLHSAHDIRNTVQAAFLDPGGLFETSFYQGTGARTGPALGNGDAVLAQPTAAVPAIRALLAGLVTATLVAAPTLGLTLDQGTALAQASAEFLLGNASAMAAIQAGTGETQATLDATNLRYASERDALLMSRSALIGVDPYQAATRLEDAQTQLEMLYAVTARTARLSLVGYL